MANAKERQQHVNKLEQWALDPFLFVKEALAVEKITSQQREGLEAYRRVVTAKIKRSKGSPLSQQEKEDCQKLGVSIESGQGTGKDAFASWVVLHFLVCMPYAKILCTAPTSAQLRTVLWTEIHKWLRKSNVQEWVTWQAEKIYLKEVGGKEWYAVPRTISSKATEEEQAETLAGLHEDYMLYVVDEASGVNDPVYRPIEGSMTGACNMALLIGNPTKGYGYFYESSRANRKDWVCLHWNSEESEIVTAEHINRMAERYGRESNMYRIRVLGMPPTGTPDALVPWDWIQRAVEADIDIVPGDPLALGIDVARMGDDLTVIYTRRGLVTLAAKTFAKLDGIQVAEWAQRELYEQLTGEEQYAVAVDVIGVGASVFDHLNRYAAIPRLYGVNVAESPAREDKYDRLRDEILWNVRLEFESGLVKIPSDGDLMHEMNAITYQVLPNGKIKVESKKDMKKRGLASPNHLDAYALALHAYRSLARPTFAPVTRRRVRRGLAYVG